ncbi:MAG: InlB B-repeat-containing protein, partial [Lachnospiraceae bacterium]|nr:InlB B-repeat-containing protein [Lachnospiraceae bacterium]
MRYGLRRATAAFMFFIMLFTSIPTDTAVAASLSSQTSTNVTESVDNETAAAVSQNDETDDITPPSEDPSDEVIDAAPAEEDDLSLPEDAAPADPAEVEEEEDSPEIAEYDADDTKIHLNANGGSFSDGKDTIDTYPDDSISSSYVPTKKGWVFVKWTKDQGGLESVSGETYPRTRFTEEIAAGTTLYAQWTQDYWTVTYDFANGSYTGSDENLKVGGGYLQNYNTGYKKVTSQVYYVPKTHNLYTGYGYYYPTGSSLSNTDLHYSYKGWTLDGSTEYSISWNNEISGDMTIYVLYQKNKHIIKYHANDETAWFDVTEYDEEAGTSTTVKSEVKTSKETGTYTSMSRYYAPSTSNPRYVFAGWYLDAECTQTPTWYTDSSCETVKEEVTWGDSEYNYLKLDQDYELYAKWVSTNKVLTFDANGGYFSNSGNNYSKTETTKQYGGAEGTTLSSYTSVYNPYREDLHYTFTGWYADKDCTGDPVYTPYDGYSYTYIEGFEFGSSDTIYYAGWEKNRSVVTFNLNGGYITQYKDYTTGETVQNATATTVKYPVGSDNRLDSTPSDSYIKWEGGAKAFEAWYTAATGGSEVGYLYSKYFNEDTEIFAHWVDTYPIKFDANGGRIKTNGHYNDQSEYVYDYVADLTIRTGNGGRLTDYDKVSSSNMCWYEGGVQSDAKAFDGWFTDAEGGEKVDVDYSYSPTDAITLYAHWTPVYTINFDANGGKFRINGVWNSELQKTVYEYVDTVDAGKTGAYGKINGYPSNPVWYKDGAESEEKLFYSWFDGETKVDSISEYVPTGNTTLKAHWSDRYTITFNANGGKISGETSKTYYTNGQRKLSSYPYSSNMTAPEGQDVLFRGWYVSTDEDKTIISSSDIYNHVFDGDTTLMAYWQPKYTITFNADANGGYIRKYEDGEYVNKPYVELTTGANGTVEYYYYVPDDDDVKGASDKYRFEGWYTEKDGG